VPVVSGRLTRTFATEQIFDFVSFIEKSDFWNAQIEQIYVADNKNIELIPRVGSGVILFGNLSNFATKLNKLQKLYSNAFNEIGWNRYKTIDLRYENQIVCTKIE
jgi:cell division protein FtsQ